ncbi:J domain-containing protein [Desulfuromonas sp. AOP6]|uniref:J domain-containing protein n=1 Tax=Desulfuromonas sp. AOP6 TaxID=1566351 RepID=UPI0012745095|nr:J domain-containing protein [Desulfuromonas sp. AOP6]BCA80571.1 hypothetical protein AOP6_2358 [Desulfuromonas sp. AOP6]
MVQMTEAALFDACRILFGQELNLNRDFLFYLQPCGAKSAYRSKAKQTHPDRFADAEKKRQNVLFHDLTSAYKLINTFLEQREKGHILPLRNSGPRARTSASPTRPRPPASPAGTFYAGDLPQRNLEFGLYLYYRGYISYQQLIAALVWQRAQRPAIGEIARRWGWLDEVALRHVLTSRGAFSRFGQRAVKLGVLTPFQVQTLLRYQQNLHKRIGQYFVESNLLSAQDIEKLVEELKTHNQKVAVGRRSASPSF